MISLLTPCRSEADQVKISLFLVRTLRSYFSSSLGRLAAMATFLCGSASLRGVDFVSSCSLRSVLPFGMSSGSRVLVVAWTELMFL